MALRRFGKDMIRDKRFGFKNLIWEFADAAEIHSEMPPLESILGLQTSPRRCVGDGPMVAGAILGAQNLSSSIIAFPKRLKATSINKIRIEIKIFFGSGGAFGAH